MARVTGPVRELLERHQVAVWLAAIAVGAVVGGLVPGVAGPSGRAVTPVLAVLLWATFLELPLARLAAALVDRRFVVTLLVVDLVAAPAVALGLSRAVADDAALLVGVLLVLLAPCIDYVVVFTRITGGAAERLLAATPLLLVGQMLLLPGLLRLGAGPVARTIDVRPLAEAFVVLILAPLVVAALTRWAAARSRTAARLGSAASAAMVPVMALTLALVVASQVHHVGARAGDLVRAVPLFVAFALVMLVTGTLAARAARLSPAPARAVVLSGVTRNSLVVLPVALALPPALGLAPLVVVTQTLVELVLLVTLVRVLPRIAPEPAHG